MSTRPRRSLRKLWLRAHRIKFNQFTNNREPQPDLRHHYAEKLARSAVPPELASPLTTRRLTTALELTPLACALPRTCDWTCGTAFDICFSAAARDHFQHY